MEDAIPFLDLLQSISLLLCKGDGGEKDMLVRLQNTSTALRREFCTDYVEHIQMEALKNTIAKKHNNKTACKLPLSIKFTEELQASVLGKSLPSAAKNTPCLGSHSVFHYGYGYLCLRHLELMREAKGIMFNLRTRLLKENATKTLAERLRNFYVEKEATEVQSLQELRAIIQNPIVM
jgi:hypothetical protein